MMPYTLQPATVYGPAQYSWAAAQAAPAQLRKFRVEVTMDDGSTGTHFGMYRTAVIATTRAMELFPDAARIDTKEVP